MRAVHGRPSGAAPRTADRAGCGRTPPQRREPPRGRCQAAQVPLRQIGLHRPLHCPTLDSTASWQVACLPLAGGRRNSLVLAATGGRRVVLVLRSGLAESRPRQHRRWRALLLAGSASHAGHQAQYPAAWPSPGIEYTGASVAASPLFPATRAATQSLGTSPKGPQAKARAQAGTKDLGGGMPEGVQCTYPQLLRSPCRWSQSRHRFPSRVFFFSLFLTGQSYFDRQKRVASTNPPQIY